MSCCILNPKPLCKIPACTNPLVTGFAAPEAGTYTLILEFLGVEYRYEQEFDEDEAMEFDLTGKLLNEKQGYIGKIIDSDGDVVELHQGEIVYDGIQFETIISL